LTSRRPRLLLAVLALSAFVAALAVGRAVTDSEPSAPATAAARTEFPGLEPAAAEPTLPGLTSVAPAPGEVAQASGPLDDRFVLSDLRFDGGVLHGVATVTSDVSEILDFEALAGFYDDRGRLLATATFVHHLAEGHGHDEAGHEDAAGPPSEVQEFDIPVPAEAQGRAVSAAVGVPVLVNE
jgi:hypothetical protein